MEVKLSSFCRSAGAIVFWAIILWGETVGNVHAFRQHGPDDGFTALITPPWAWYRGIEYFWHEERANTDGSYPPLTADEQDVLSRLVSKALEQSLTNGDLELYRQTVVHYSNRTGRPLRRGEIEEFLKLMRSTIDYQRELGKCLLISIDEKQPFVSTELEHLQTAMRSSGTRKARLETDLREIESAGRQSTYTDEWGRQHNALTREQVVNGLRIVDIAEDNFKRLAAVLEASIAH